MKHGRTLIAAIDDTRHIVARSAGGDRMLHRAMHFVEAKRSLSWFYSF